jgi:type IV pilus assembly protein PilE
MKLHRLKRITGFSLIELMVVVVIAAILVSLALPSYMLQVRQSRRTEARTAILDLAGREERFFSTNGANYTNAPGSLGYNALPAIVGTGYYQLSVCVPAGACDPNPNPPAAPSYYISAVPVAGQSQVNDLQCQSFGVDSAGRQFARDSAGNDNSVLCWSR